MHVLHRPHLPRAFTVTVIAAALAIVLTLAVAAGLNDQMPASSIASSPPAAVHASTTAPGPSTSPFTRSPFASLLGVPVTPRWWKTSR
jgi:hypothetical protein